MEMMIIGFVLALVYLYVGIFCLIWVDGHWHNAVLEAFGTRLPVMIAVICCWPGTAFWAVLRRLCLRRPRHMARRVKPAL